MTRLHVICIPEILAHNRKPYVLDADLLGKTLWKRVSYLRIFESDEAHVADNIVASLIGCCR